MPRGEKPFGPAHGPEPVEGLFRFLASLILREFCRKVTIRFEAGKVTDVETEVRRRWQHKDLPQESSVRGVE